MDGWDEERKERLLAAGITCDMNPLTVVTPANHANPIAEAFIVKAWAVLTQPCLCLRRCPQPSKQLATTDKASKNWCATSVGRGQWSSRRVKLMTSCPLIVTPPEPTWKPSTAALLSLHAPPPPPQCSLARAPRSRAGEAGRSRTTNWIFLMFSRTIVMLAALGARTSAFHIPVVSRTGHGNALRRVTADSVSRTQGHLLAVESAAAVGVEVPPNAADTTNDAVTVKSPFLQTLVKRGFYHQCTNVEGLDDILLTGEAVKAYLGFDATADRYSSTAAVSHVLRMYHMMYFK